MVRLDDVPAIVGYLVWGKIKFVLERWIFFQ
jgi:hypothetical protein